MSAARQAFGELGERIAERWLRRRGWTVVQRRFRSGHRDIDLVVERDGTVAFVEVKARRGAEFGGPVQAACRDLTHGSSAVGVASEFVTVLSRLFPICQAPMVARLDELHGQFAVRRP